MTDASHCARTHGSHPVLTRPGRLTLLAFLLAVAIILSLYAAGTGAVLGDDWVIEQAQRIESNTLATLGDWLDWFGSGLGMMIPAALIGALLAWRRWWGYAALTVAAPLISGVLNTTLKSLLDSPRPTGDIARITGEASGMGFPSGHAMRAMIFYGLIWVIASRLISRGWLRHSVQALAILMVILHGLARIYIGVHWPSDVLGGYVWGFLALAVLVIAHDFVASRTGWFDAHYRRAGQA